MRAVQANPETTANGSSTPQASYMSHGDGVFFPETSIQPSREIVPSHGGPVVDTEVASNNNLLLTSFNFEDNLFDPDWSYVPNLSPKLVDDYVAEQDATSSLRSNELQLTNGTMSPPGQSIHSGSSIPVALECNSSSSLFQKREFPETELGLASDVALHILRSYPYMIASQGSVPPFIHPQYQSLDEGNTTRPSPLHASLNLVKMLLHDRRVNKGLMWGLIRVEQERLLNEHLSFSRWELLQALQSLVVYLLLRIIEGRHEYTNFDSQLLISVNAICRHLTIKYGKLISPEEVAGREMPWKDWVFNESRRRTSSTVVVITRILHAQVSPPFETMTEYSHFPAPSPMKLWRAENETDWAVDYTEYQYQNAMHGMLKIGDLVQLKGRAGKQNDGWYAYADSLGLLVTLAADLIC
ncbi:unnamed protein product [Clonostachys chloroleuca]|uniref:Transcription factor domain-containing protein n=1 Tax=Clonostachys chloroleuca TaxID=1926264 RepID=A0AA35LUL5_9HYPO|nr:unnamed protein product [Clonostachys chloroleuca]